MRTLRTEWQLSGGSSENDSESLESARRPAQHSLQAEGAFHDVGGPLTYLLANLEYLDVQLAGHEGDLPPGRVHDLRQCLREAALGAARIKDILLDAAGRARPTEGRCDLRQVLLSCIKVARTEIDHRARVITEFDAVPDVAGSESRLSRVFHNLIVNAAQAVSGDTDNEHFIRVVAKAEGGRHVTIEITDSGPGIAEEDLERVFDAYFTTKPAGEGTGLGLTICQHIVTELGGTLSVQSVLGRGATFRVTLPVADDPSAPDSKPSQARARLAPSTPPVRRLPLRQLR